MKTESLVHPHLADSHLSPLSKSILRTLLYFNVFRYPLLADEIFYFCHTDDVTFKEIKEELNFLESEQLVKHYSGYYYLGNEGHIIRRQKGNSLAQKFLNRARLMTNLIACFPFVESVCISGSLSKGFMDEKSDVDYFIITSPKRLWLCRSLLTIFKKVFLLNSKKYFCVNYFVSSDNLEIPDKNIFTATEIVTLKPVYNFNTFDAFMKSNKWVENYFPHHPKHDPTLVIPQKKFFLKTIAEKLLSGSFGEWLDNYFFKVTLNYWRKKFPSFSQEEFDLNLRSRKNVSKHHPRGFQLKMLKDYESAIRNFESTMYIQLD